MGIEYGYTCEVCQAWCKDLDALHGHALKCAARADDWSYGVVTQNSPQDKLYEKLFACNKCDERLTTHEFEGHGCRTPGCLLPVTRRPYEKPVVIDERSIGADVEIVPTVDEHQCDDCGELMAYSLDGRCERCRSMSIEARRARRAREAVRPSAQTVNRAARRAGEAEEPPTKEEAGGIGLVEHQKQMEVLANSVYPNTACKPKMTKEEATQVLRDAFAKKPNEGHNAGIVPTMDERPKSREAVIQPAHGPGWCLSVSCPRCGEANRRTEPLRKQRDPSFQTPYRKAQAAQEPKMTIEEAGKVIVDTLIWPSAPSSKPYELAQEVFASDLEEYDQVNPDWMRALQAELRQWEIEKFNGGTIEGSTLGANEEVGELAEALILLAAMKSSTGRMAHAVLKRGQEVRGFDDPKKFLEKAADAIADTMVFSIQLASKLRLDAATLLTLTAEDVMERVGATPDLSGPALGASFCINAIKVKSHDPDRFARSMVEAVKPPEEGFAQVRGLEDFSIPACTSEDPVWMIAANKSGHRGHNIHLLDERITFHSHQVRIQCTTCDKLEHVEIRKSGQR